MSSFPAKLQVVTNVGEVASATQLMGHSAVCGAERT